MREGGTDTELGWSGLMKERHRRESIVGERKRECPSNGYTHTYTHTGSRQQAAGRDRGAREDMSLEDMSNSHATGSNA